MRNTKKKILSIFMLLALVTNNLLYPINYVTAQNFGDVDFIETGIEEANTDEEDSEDENIENSEIGETVEGSTGDIKGLTGEVSEIGSGELENLMEETVEGSTGDIKGLTGEVSEIGSGELENLMEETVEGTTGDIKGLIGEVSEIGSGELENLMEETVGGSTGDIKGLTGEVSEIGSGELENLIEETVELTTGGVEELTGEIVESTGTGEETIIEEIKYNEEPIIGEKTYNDVTVRVEALSGIFPEGTELKIEPVKGGDLSSLKDKLVEEKEEIKEDTTVVAFDITFKYEGEEIQPKDGEKVKVTFDYSMNKDLVKADKNKNQEIKVYHMEDKDEEGNKVVQGEEKVVDVTNKQESAEKGIAVVDADSFSVYVVTYGNEDPEFSATLVGEDSARNNFHYKTITISDGENTYTLMDRNLGARVAWNTGIYTFYDKSNYNTEDDYYGYYYQWGNNYGFSNTQKYGDVISDAIPSNYVSSTWSTSNLGGYNLRGDTTNTESARQGPCPRGWHVPSSDEWEAIRDAWCVSAEKGEDCNTGTGFAEALQMPTAGYRVYNYGKFIYYGSGSNGTYWSSTSDNTSSANFLLFTSWNIKPKYNPGSNDNTFKRTTGMPVRCLMNKTNAVTLYLNPNGGRVEDGIKDADAQGKVILPTATRNEYNFDGWYDAVDGGNRRGGSGDDITINEDTDLYAHWSEPISNHIVTFNNGTNESIVEVESGATVTAPDDPTNGDQIFAGWYTSIDGGQTLSDTVFDFDTPITTDITLYAKWVSCEDGEIYSPELGECVARWHELVSLTDDNTTTTVGSYEQVEGFPSTMTVIENDILESPEGEALSEAEGKELVGDVTIDFGGDAIFSHLVQVNIPVTGSSKAYVKVKHVGSDEYNYDGLTTNIEASCVDGDIENVEDMYHGEYMDVESGYISIYTCEASSFAAFGLQKGIIELPKVTFEPENGSGATVVEVESGTRVNSEDIPTVTKDGYTFSGWYLTGAESAFDFSGTTITGDITLYARWEEYEGVTYTVTFDTNRGTFADTPASQNVLGGEYVIDPATLSGYKEPELPGYTFTGWWTEPRGGTQWDFGNDLVTGNITLYAHWIYDLPYGDLDVYMIDSSGSLIKYVMMDRNMGATGVYNKNFGSQNPSSFGFVYQWGNNYGFPRCNSNGTCNYSPITDTQVSVDIVENYIPSKFASSTWIGKNGGNGSSKSWHSNSGNILKYLWGNGNTTNMQGPCPDGYHVPSTSETNDEDGLFGVWGNIHDKTINTINGKGSGFSFLSDDQELFSSQFLFPHAGNHKKGNTNEQEKNMCGDYWTATPSGLENAINMRFCKDGDNKYYDENGKFLFTNNSQRNNGSTLRCFKNSTDSANLDIVNGGKKGLITVHKVDGVTTINAIKEPENTDANGTGLIFGGWYTSQNFESSTMKTGGDTLSPSVTALYAKWDCPDGLVYNSDNECISGVLVRFMDEETEYTRSVVLSGEEVRAPVPNPEKAGYIFTGWFESGANLPFVFTGTPITGNLDLYAHWDINNNKYDVNVSVVTGDEYKGYLSGMGSTGISLTGLYNYGTELVFIAVPKLGYVFDYWMNGDQVLSGTDLGDGRNQLTVFVDQVLDIIAFFKETPTPYTVEHYQENLGQTGYDFVWSGTMYGIANEQTNVTGTNYTGFILSGDLASYQTGINSDGSTVVRLYYNRGALHTVTFENWNGDFLWSGKVASGETPTYNGSTPSRVSTEQNVYTFDGWYPEFSPVTGDITYTAVYTESTRLYTVTLTGTPAGYGTLTPESLSKEYGAAIVISGDKLRVGGTEVTLSGNEGYEFQEWTGTCGKVEKQVCDEHIIYSHSDPIEFTGGNNLIITNPGYDLFSESNYQKDFEISFDIVDQNLSSSVNQATILNVKDEDQSNVWPGIAIRKSSSAGKIEITATSNYGKGYKTSKNYSLENLHSIKISRINSILYVSINGSENEQLYDYSGFNNYFDKPITIGSSYKDEDHLLRPAKITLSNILIKSIDTCYTGNVYVVTGDCQMTAVFSASDEYPVRIASNNAEYGTVSSDSVTKPYGTTITESGNTLNIGGTIVTATTGTAPTGHTYTFSGWRFSSECESGGNYVVAEGCAITGNFEDEINEYTVTFDLSGGSLTGDMTLTKDYTIETPTISLVGYEPVRNGYTFTGWYRDGTLVTSMAGGETGDYTLVARWEAQERPIPVVVFMKMLVPGEYTDYDSQLMWGWGTVGELYTAPLDEFTPTGFYYEEDNESNVRSVIVSPDVDNEVHLYFSRISYPLIIINAGEGLSNTATGSRDYLYEEPVTISVTPFTGWEFVNWTLIQGTLSGVNDLTQRTLSFNMPAENIQISPNLSHIEYTLSFNSASGTTVESQTYYYDDILSGLDSAITTRTGYVFSGWYLSGVLYTSGSRMPAESITLTAQWKVDENNNGIADEDETKYVVTVNYYNMNTGGMYSGVTSTTTFTGLAGLTGYAVVEPPYGFYLDTTTGTTNASIIISENTAENVINVYYARNRNHILISYTGTFAGGTDVTINPALKERYYYGEHIHFDAIPNTGYTLQSWIYSGDKWETLSTNGNGIDFDMGTGEVSLTVGGGVETYTITYHTEPGTSDPMHQNPDSYTILSGILQIYDPIMNYCYNFVGWTGGTTGDWISTPTTGLVINTASGVGNREYYANREIKTYELTLSVDPSTGGTVSGAGIYECMQSIYLYAIPNTGYHFVGWFDGNNNLFSDQSAYFYSADGSGGTSLTARFEINQYYITIDKYGSGEFWRDSATSGRYPYGTGITIVAYPNYGYKIQKWTKNGGDIVTGANDELYTGSTLSFLVTETGDFVVYFEPETYNITYIDSGSVLTGLNPTTYTVESPVYSGDLPILTKDGYDFDGWFDNSLLHPVEWISQVGGATIYAKWTPINYDINYHLLSGESVPWENYLPYELYQSYDIETPRTDLPQAQKSGYVFSGWVDYSGKSFTGFGGGMTGDLDLYPTWKSDVMDITVNYYEMNTSGQYYPNSWTYYTTYYYTGLTESEFIVPDYTTTGFEFDYYVLNGSTGYNNPASLVVSGNASGNVIDVYYERNERWLQVMGDPGSNISITGCEPNYSQSNFYCKYYYDTEITIDNLIYYYDTGYEFSGWYNDPEYPLPSGAYLTTGGVTFNMPDNDVHISLYTKHIEYILTFTGYEGAEVINSDYINITLTGENYEWYESAITLPYLSKTGYYFDGWSEHGYTRQTDTWYMPAENITLTAEFSPNTEMGYCKYYYLQDIEGTGYTLSGDLTECNTNGVTDELIPGRDSWPNIEGFNYSGFGYSGVLLPYEQWPYIKATGDNYINYYYDRENYSVYVNYDDNKLSITGTGEYRYDAPVTLVATAKTGYKFSGYDSQGWFPDYDTGNSTLSFNMPAISVELYAYAEPIEYAIEYELNGGYPTPYGYLMTGYTVEDEIAPFDLYKDGYTFLGWTGGTTGDWISTPTTGLVIPQGSIGNRKYFANWEPAEQNVTVNYYLNKIDAENNQLTGGVDVYLTGVIFTGLTEDVVNIYLVYGTGIEGYEYSTSLVYGSDLSGGIETGTTTILGDGSRVIDMYYIPKKYQFTLNTAINSSTEGSSESTGYYYGANVILSGESTDVCYLWSGWIVSGVSLLDNTINSVIFTMPANDVVVTSSVKEKSYNIIFNGNGSTTGQMSTLSVQCTTGTLPQNSFERDGYTFIGWSTTSTGTVEFTNEAEVHRLSTISGENVILYAVWSINHYTVTFDLNGGKLTGDMTLTTGYTVETPSISLTGYIPVRSGYIFTGWYKDDTLVTSIAGGETGDYTLTGRWEADSVILYTFYLSETLSGETLRLDIVANFPKVDSFYAGEIKTFTGFTYNSGDTRNKTGTIVSWDGGQNEILLYYTRNEYPLIIINTGEGLSNIATGSRDYLYEEPVTISVTPFTGWEFVDWTLIQGTLSGVNLSSTTLSFSMPAEQVQISPNLSHIEYTLSFNSASGTSVESQTYYYDDILSGLDSAITTRTGYVFSGWYLSGVLYTSGSRMPAESITFTAQWKLDLNNNGVADEEEEPGLVTVHYVYASGSKAGEDKTGVYLSGLSFEITGRVIEYYEADVEPVIGTGLDEPQTITVTYSPIHDDNNNEIADEQEYFTIEFSGGENGVLSGTTKYENLLPLSGLTMSGAGIIVPEVIVSSGYVFSGWSPEIDENEILSGGIVYFVIYGEDKNYNGENDEFEPKYTLTINYVYSGGGVATGPYITENQLSGFTYNVNSPSIQYYQANITNISGTITGNVEETVIYSPINDNNHNGIADEQEQPSGGGHTGGGGGVGGGGGGSSISDYECRNCDGECINGECVEGTGTGTGNGQHNSAEVFIYDKSKFNLNYSEEMNRAYQYAYAKGITTMDSIEKADMGGPLTRIAMAKMLSQYAINVLGMKPDESRQKVFSDVSNELDGEYNSGVSLVYQLGIMGINMPDERFRPFDYVSRAEFVTALSRTVYSAPDGNDLYYSTHMDLLKNLGIITNTNPDMLELRGYVMIMLMRIALKENGGEDIERFWDDGNVVENYFNQSYEKGDYYSKIGNLQDMLSYYGYYIGKKNNRYDKNTIEAVYRFQIDMGILDESDINNPARGWMGPTTRGVLNKKRAEYQLVK